MTRTNRILATAALVAAEAALLAAPAFGQDATVYANETDYDAAAGSSAFTIDFNGSSGSAVAGDSFSAEVAFSSPQSSNPTQVLWSGDAITDTGSTIAPNGVGPVAGVFAGTATAFKFTFASATVPATVLVYDEADNLIAALNAPNTTGFFGVVSTTAIKRFLVNPGISNPVFMTRDRFFMDDFSATTSGGGGGGGAGGGGSGGGATDPLSLCQALVAAVEGADPSAFKCEEKQGSLARRLGKICDRIESGEADDLEWALKKLERCILPKTDGEKSPCDWVVDATLQQELEDGIVALMSSLEEALAALDGASDGGCDRGDDDDHDGGHGSHHNGD